MSSGILHRKSLLGMNNRTFLIWFALGHLANDWPIATLWLIVPAAGLAMGLSPGEITLFNIGGALAYIPAGFLADQVSNRGRLLIATFWWVAGGYALAALTPGFWSLALLLAVAGMGNAAWHPIATGVLTRDNKDGRAQALGIHAIGGSFAEVLAPLSAGFLLSFFDWRSALAISVLPTVLLGLCFLCVARAIPVIEKKSVDRQDALEMMHVWGTGGGLRIIAMISLYNMALIAVLSMIPLYLAEAHDFAPTTIGIVFAALLLTGAFAQPWAGWISDKLGRKPVLVIGNGLAALAFAILSFGPTFWVMISMMAVGIAALDATRAAMLAAAVDHTDRSESTTLGIAFVLMEGVGALGAVLAGMATGISWNTMFGLAALFAFGAAILSAGADVRLSADSASGRTGLLPTWRERVRRRRELKNRLTISPHLIDDMGMTVKEVEAEIAKRFWVE